MTTHTLPSSDTPEHVLRCTSTADFLAALPQLVGFTAEDSLFVVFFAGNRSGGTLRVDLPQSESPQHLTQFIDGVCAILQDTRNQHGWASPAVVISSARTFQDAQGIPWRRLARRLERRLERGGNRARELCCIAPDGWASYLDPVTPLGGHPLSEIAASTVATNTAVPELAALSQFPLPPQAKAENIAATLGNEAAPALDIDSASMLDALTSQTHLDTARIVDIIRLANVESGWLTLFDALAAIASRLPDSPAHAHTHQTQTALAKVRRASEQLVEVVSLTPHPLRPAVISICAIAWWLRGLQSVAHSQIAQALEIDPWHEMATITQRIISEERFPLNG